MYVLRSLLPAIIDLSFVVAHAGTHSTPVPHWVALLVGVVGLWVAIGGGVVVVERLLARLSRR